jgi:serine/threonine protein kinase/formylglycine-generating enzyme required for sulfatase activity
MKSNPPSSFDSKARSLFERALQEPRPERTAFVRKQAQGDGPLEQHVLRLLQEAESKLRETFGAEVNEESNSHNTATFELLQKLVVAAPLDTVRYRVEHQIGRGGMGAVLSVRDAYLNRELAMKVMLQSGTGSTAEDRQFAHQSLGRFLEEAQVTSQLDHPGVVPVHELGIDPAGNVFFTMRLVRGQTLREIFDKVQRAEEGWTRQRALEVILKVCDTIAYAHSKGVLHRDLKPANIMVGRFGEVYVMDWGLAKVLGKEDRHDLRIKEASEAGREEITVSTRTLLQTARREDADTLNASVVSMDGQQLGTPAYMAPEQARSEQLDERADVYAIGAMTYTMLAGRAPFGAPGDSPYSVLDKVIAGPPERLEKLVEDVAAELVAIVERAMARNRLGRYASVAELGNDIRAYLDGRVVHAYQTGPVAELKMWMRRNQPLAMSIAAAALLGVVGFTVSVWKWQEAAEQRKVAKGEEENAKRALEGETKAKADAVENAKKARLAADEAKSKSEDADRQKQAAVNAKQDAESAAKKLKELLERFNQIKAVLDFDRALEETQDLHAPRPDKLPRMQGWLEAAERLLATRPEIDKEVARLRAMAVSAQPAQATSEQRAEVERLSAHLEHLRRLQDTIVGKIPPERPMLPPSLAKKPGQSEQDWLQLLLTTAEAQCRRLEQPTSTLGDGEGNLLAATEKLVAVMGRYVADGQVRIRRAHAWALAAQGNRELALQTIRSLQADAAALPTPDERKLKPAKAAKFLAEKPTLLQDLAFFSEVMAARLGMVGLEVERAERDLSKAQARLAEAVRGQIQGDNSETQQFLYAQLDRLSSRFAELESARAMIARERAFAAEVAELSSNPPSAWQRRWERVGADLQSNPKYQRLQRALTATTLAGLVPIGADPNPTTGLWEFYDLRSAWDGVSPVSRIEVPNHEPGGREGSRVGPMTGVVFVLIPPGELLRTGRDGTASTTIPVPAFLIAKHELTQGQWARLWLHDADARWPSAFQVGQWTQAGKLTPEGQWSRTGTRQICGETNPVESISWNTCRTLLRDHGWWFPTEDQWEYAARAGTKEDWVVAPSLLKTVANLADKENAPPEWALREPAPWDDNHKWHAPVGSFQGSEWGLYDIHGNVAEWCDKAVDGRQQIHKGGAFDTQVDSARFNDTTLENPSKAQRNIGLRPVRLLP